MIHTEVVIFLNIRVLKIRVAIAIISDIVKKLESY